MSTPVTGSHSEKSIAKGRLRRPILGVCLVALTILAGWLIERPGADAALLASEEWQPIARALSEAERAQLQRRERQPDLGRRLLGTSYFPQPRKLRFGQPGFVPEGAADAPEGAPSLPVIVAAARVNGDLEVYGRVDGTIVVVTAGDTLGGWSIVGSDLRTVELRFDDVTQRVDIRRVDAVGGGAGRNGRGRRRR